MSVSGSGHYTESYYITWHPDGGQCQHPARFPETLAREMAAFYIDDDFASAHYALDEEDHDGFDLPDAADLGGRDLNASVCWGPAY